jgi:hypothetical protein
MSHDTASKHPRRAAALATTTNVVTIQAKSIELLLSKTLRYFRQSFVGRLSDQRGQTRHST